MSAQGIETSWVSSGGKTEIPKPSQKNIACECISLECHLLQAVQITDSDIWPANMKRSILWQQFSYMDDGLISVDSIKETKQLIREVKEICTKSHLHLHEFVSNNKEVLDVVSENEQDCTTKEVDMNYIIPMQSVLGVK